MNKFLLLLTVFILINSGCAPVSTPPPLDDLIPNATLENTPVPLESSPTITDTPLPVITSTPSAIFFDDFSTNLKPGWEWLNENPRFWSLDAVPGSLQLNVQGGDFNHSNATNILLRDTPGGDFQIETHLIFYPEEVDQFAGLVIAESNKNFVQAGYAVCSPIFSCIGRGFYMDVFIDGDLQLPRQPSSYKDGQAYLRLTRQDDSISFNVSQDGVVWYQIGTVTIDMEIKKIGLVTGQNLSEDDNPAIFEYFLVTHP